MATDLLEAITTCGGFTYDPTDDHLFRVGVDTGYAIAIPGTERLIGAGVNREEFARTFAFLLSDPNLSKHLDDGAVVGGWYSSDRDVYMIELSQIWHVSRASAIAIGRHRNQEAIYDLATGEEIPTGGTGDATP